MQRIGDVHTMVIHELPQLFGSLAVLPYFALRFS
jgi:hypothetical protein